MKDRQIDVVDFSLSYDTLSISRGYDDSTAMLISVIKPNLDDPEFLFEPHTISTQSTSPVKYTWKV
jgi:hypothetical protein